MSRLTHRNFKNLLGCISELYAHHDLDGFAQHVLAVGRKAVPADWSACDELNVRRKRHRWVTDPANLILGGAGEPHDYFFTEHPLVVHLKRTGDVPPLRFSDLLTRRQYRETTLYREAYRRFGVEFQLGFTLPSPTPGFVFGLAFNRKQRDFTEEDRLTFELLRPHLLQAYRNAELITRLREQALFGEQALEATHQGVIVLDAQGRINFCSPNARVGLAAYFPAAKRAVNDQLPEALQQWVRQQGPPPVKNGKVPSPRQPLTVERADRRLVVRLVTDSTPGQHVLVLAEHRATLSPEPLQRLGLTAREAEVLLWVTQGKTSPEVGVILGCSTATVNKHLEHIFAKLGVETRTAAALRATEVLNRNGA